MSRRKKSTSGSSSGKPRPPKTSLPGEDPKLKQSITYRTGEQIEIRGDVEGKIIIAEGGSRVEIGKKEAIVITTRKGEAAEDDATGEVNAKEHVAEETKAGAEAVTVEVRTEETKAGAGVIAGERKVEEIVERASAPQTRESPLPGKQRVAPYLVRWWPALIGLLLALAFLLRALLR